MACGTYIVPSMIIIMIIPTCFYPPLYKVFHFSCCVLSLFSLFSLFLHRCMMMNRIELVDASIISMSHSLVNESDQLC